MGNIAHCLIWYLPPTMGYIHDQLVALGPERSVVLAIHPVEPERFPFDRVYTLFPPEGTTKVSPQDRFLMPPFASLWQPILRDEGTAVLHVHDGRLGPSFLPVARSHGIPIVTTFFGRDATAGLDNSRYTDALRLLFSQGDLFTVMSRDMARQIQRLGCPAHKIRVIHHGILLSRYPFHPRRAPADGPRIILTAGRLIPKKGPDDLARAFVTVYRKHPNTILRVIGDGPLRPKMEAILNNAGVADRVEFLGALDPIEVAAEMGRAHVFCLPSRVGPDGDSEGIPNALKEAMATGLPVVSTYHAGIPELIEDGASGYLVAERDVEALADRLCQVLEEPQRWEGMGRVGRAKVEAEFSVESVARQLDTEVYRPLLRSAIATD